MTVVALSTGETLLVLKLAFLVLLYAFIVLIVRSATKDLGGAPQESIILGAAEAAALRARLPVRPARFVVVAGASLHEGAVVEVREPTVAGRGPESTLQLDGDDFASARHALIEPRSDGVWIEDLGSTNGTYLNEEPLNGPQPLHPGDRIRIGDSEFSYLQ